MGFKSMSELYEEYKHVQRIAMDYPAKMWVYFAAKATKQLCLDFH